MLTEDFKTPLLLIALDNVSKKEIEEIGALSIRNSKLLDGEIANLQDTVRAYNASDLKKKANRIPIPINDRLLPIHYIAGNTSNNSIVDYFDENAVLQTGNNQVNLSFEIKNGLSAIGTIASIFMGLSGNKVLSSKQPRVSFFSANLCVFNANITGINRSTQISTDKEVITLSLEIAPNILNKIAEIAKQAVPEVSFKNTTGGSARATATEITAEEADHSFVWYQLFTVDEYNAIDVPDFTPDYTVDRDPVRVLKVQSFDRTLAPRGLLSINYRREFVTLESGQTVAETENYSVMLFDENYYFGVKK